MMEPEFSVKRSYSIVASGELTPAQADEVLRQLGAAGLKTEVSFTEVESDRLSLGMATKKDLQAFYLKEAIASRGAYPPSNLGTRVYNLLGKSASKAADGQLEDRRFSYLVNSMGEVNVDLLEELSNEGLLSTIHDFSVKSAKLVERFVAERRALVERLSEETGQ